MGGLQVNVLEPMDDDGSGADFPAGPTADERRPRRSRSRGTATSSPPVTCKRSENQGYLIIPGAGPAPGREHRAGRHAEAARQRRPARAARGHRRRRPLRRWAGSACRSTRRTSATSVVPISRRERQPSSRSAPAPSRCSPTSPTTRSSRPTSSLGPRASCHTEVVTSTAWTPATRSPTSRPTRSWPDGSSTAPSSCPRTAAHGARSPIPLHPERDASGSPPAGIDELWTHQAAAIDAAPRRAATSSSPRAPRPGSRSATSCRSSTPSSASEPDTALLMFPTKALAQDQLRSCGHGSSRACNAVTYDGDTPPDDRAWARKNANVVLTNPEMLHQGILPYHRRWATFLMRLRLDRGRRAPLAARDLRQQRRARPAPAAAGLRALRLEPVVLLRERDHRQPGGARARVVRAARHRDRRRRLAAGRSGASGSGSGRCSTSTPVGARARTRRPPSCSPASCAPAGRRSRSRAAAAAPSSWPRRPGGGSRRTTPTMAGPRRRVPRRVPPRGTARARTPARRRQPARRRRHERARARDRRRWARRRRAQRVPGHARVDAPAIGTGGPHRPAGRGGARRR